MTTKRTETGNTKIFTQNVYGIYDPDRKEGDDSETKQNKGEVGEMWGRCGEKRTEEAKGNNAKMVASMMKTGNGRKEKNQTLRFRYGLGRDQPSIYTIHQGSRKGQSGMHCLGTTSMTSGWHKTIRLHDHGIIMSCCMFVAHRDTPNQTRSLSAEKNG